MNQSYKMSESYKKSAVVLVLALMVVWVGCAPAEETAEETAEMAAHEDMMEAEVDGEPRVFFVDPQDGDTVTSPVLLQFGAENFVIEPVGDGTVHEGMGHFHIAVNAPCLEPGIVIPTANPWIHFGDGSAEIEMQLPLGEATLCLQIGDGEHRTLGGEGLSSVITLNVVEAEAEGDAGDEAGS
jgi:hypothetical protein